MITAEHTKKPAVRKKIVYQGTATVFNYGRIILCDDCRFSDKHTHWVRDEDGVDHRNCILADRENIRADGKRPRWCPLKEQPGVTYL